MTRIKLAGFPDLVSGIFSIIHDKLLCICESFATFIYASRLLAQDVLAHGIPLV